MSRGRRGKKKSAAKKQRKALKEPKKIIYPDPVENICTECMENLKVNNYTYILSEIETPLNCVYCNKETISKFVSLNRGYLRNCNR